MTRPNPLARLLLLMLTSATSPAWAASWEAIPSKNADLVLVAPGLEAPVANFQRASEGLQTFQFGRWRPTGAAYPEARLILIRISSAAPPGMTFRREPPLEERARQWLKSDRIEAGKGDTYRNVLGELEYQRFTRNGSTECVFMRQYGDTYSDQRSYFSDGSMGHGNIMIRGYYCVQPDEPLSQSTLRGFLSGIGLKGHALPASYRSPQVAAPAAAATHKLVSSLSGASPDSVRFTSMVYKTSNGQQLADELHEVSLDHGRVYIYVKWTGLTLTAHAAQLRVYDGEGRQVKTSTYEFTPTSVNWNS